MSKLPKNIEELIDSKEFLIEIETRKGIKKVRKGSKDHLKQILNHFDISFIGADNVLALKERYNSTRENRKYKPPKKGKMPAGLNKKKTKVPAAPKPPTAAKPPAEPESVSAEKIKGTYVAEDGSVYKFKPLRTNFVMRGRRFTTEEALEKPDVMEEVIRKHLVYLVRVI